MPLNFLKSAARHPMKQPAALFLLIVVTQTSPLLAGSMTLTSGNVQTTGNQVITASGARAEAVVDQRGSVVRLGSNTSAQVGDRGDVSLSKGVVLVSSGDGFLRRPTVQVTTPQGDVAVRGSAIVAVLPDGSVKMTLLEGSAQGTLGGQSMALDPGHLIVQRPEGTRDTVQVNLNTLTHSSALLENTNFKPLPALPEIRQEVAQQAQILGATVTLSRSDNGHHGVRSENAPEIKSPGPGLLARMFHLGGSNSKTDDNSTSTGPTLQIQGVNQSQPQTVVATGTQTGLLRVSGEVSGTNVFLNSAGAPGGGSGTVSLDAGGQSQVVLANGGTQQLVAQGSITFANNANLVSATPLVLVNGNTQQIALQGALTISNTAVVSGASSGLVHTGGGTLVISGGVQNVQGTGPTNVVVNSGTLVLGGGAAQQFTGGTLTVTGPGGTTLLSSNHGGVITFQSGGSSQAAAGGTP